MMLASSEWDFRFAEGECRFLFLHRPLLSAANRNPVLLLLLPKVRLRNRRVEARVEAEAAINSMYLKLYSSEFCHEH